MAGNRAGQYVRLGVIIDAVYDWRAYSLTSDPQADDGLISVTPKVVPTGTVSPRLLLDEESTTAPIDRVHDVNGLRVVSLDTSCPATTTARSRTSN